MQPSLLPLAIVALAGWAALFCALLARTRPKVGQQLAVSPRNWAEQPPAIVAMLCSKAGEVPDCAVTATYLDLIARGFLKRSVRLGQARIEIADADRSALKPYERQILIHVEARVRLGGGAVLEEVLRLESSEHAKRWMAEFSDHVIAEARQRGLVEQRVSLWACFWLWLTLLVGVVLLAAASIGTFLGVMTFLLLAQSTKFLRGYRPTETGGQLVATYRAFAAELSAGGARPNGRKAAYVAALGKGSESSPLAHQDGGEAWSNRSGKWRKVRIIDPPVGFHGTDPVAALYVIPGALAFFAVWTWLLTTCTVYPARWSIPPIIVAAGWVILGLFNFFVWRFVYRGLYDLSHGTVTQEGQVIYLDAREAFDSDGSSSYYVAMDDGRNSTAVRHEIDKTLFDQLHYGDWLRLDITPKLRCVRSTQLVPAPVPA